MDSSTPPPPPPPLDPPSKLPIKRKNPNPTSSLTTTATRHHLHDPAASADVATVSPPSKFHRIWSEPDEIRFLQCLLDCASSQKLSFPRDLRVFYRRFSASSAASQPYSNSQLYEKLRGLRKKFRAVSSRLDRGALDPSRLSPHDRALFDLSEKLWGPKYASVSPFGTGNSNGSNNVSKDFASGSGDVMPDDGVGLVGVRVSFAAELHLGSKGRDENGRGVIGCAEEEDEEEEEEEGKEDYVAHGVRGNANGAGAVRGDCHGDLKMKEVDVDCDFGRRQDGFVILNDTNDSDGGVGGIGELVKRAALDVFDQSLEEVKAGFSQECLHCYCRFSCLSDSLDSSFAASKERPRRLLDQRSAELDVFGRRLRLIIEQLLTKK